MAKPDNIPMKFGRYILPILILIPLVVLGQNLLPPIYNYKVFEYRAGGQNWGLSLNDKGEIFVANDKGLLYHNGEEWILNKLPNTTIVRSVAAIGDRIYTGSYEEFGYWKKDGTGLLEYTSLTHLIEGHTFTNEEFWQIVPFGDAVLFRSFATLYRYENEQIKVINPEFVITNIAISREKILMAAKNNGLFALSNDKPSPVENNGVLADKTIIDMLPFQNGLLIGTQLNGCFVLKENEVVPFDENINQLLQRYQLNKILQLGPSELVFGTIKNGIYLYDLKQKSIKNLNRETGLQNNTVLSMAKFQGQFWAGLENGIDRIRTNSPITYYTDYSGALGTVHDLAVQENKMYLGSNTGIYNFETDDIQFMEGSQGHSWDIELITNDVLAGHNSGTFRIDNQRLEKISSIAGGYQFVRVPEQTNTFLQGTYTGIARYHKEIDDTWSVRPLAGIDFPVKQLCFENAHTLWAAHPYKGIFRFKLDERLETVLEKQEMGVDVLPNNYNIKLYPIKNQIVIQSDGLWFKFNNISKEIVPFEEFSPYENTSLIYTDGDHFWFIADGDTKELIYTDLRENTISIVEPQLNNRLVPDMEKAVKSNDSIYLLTLSDGFARINLSQLKRNLELSKIPVPELVFLKDAKQRYAIQDSTFQIPFRYAQDLVLQVSVPTMIKPRYYYELTGASNQSKFVDNGRLEFQNLPHGSYTLSVSTVSMDNQKSLPHIVKFEIAPPWYFSKLSMALYALASILMVFLIRWYNRRKLNKKHNILKQKLHREQQEHLANLEKEKLEKEIKQKQKELARTTMNVAKKNELILELKDMLVMNKEAFTNRQRYRSLTKKLDNSINKDEDWKNFEVNFKELHEDFFENLLMEYPKLTPKDLKLCAYLKMNLSSKEIAPLMGITIRGVEIHRYRLRKKLQIDSSQNLSNFLIKFN